MLKLNNTFRFLYFSFVILDEIKLCYNRYGDENEKNNDC